MSTKPKAVVMDIWGTNSARSPGPIDTSATTQYTNVATNVPSVNCVPRSRMKLRSIRGPNCVEASVSVTIMIENTTPTTVITAAASAVKIWRAASALPSITHEGNVIEPLYTARSSTCVPAYSASAATTSTIGTSHRFVRSASRRQSEPSRNISGCDDRLASGADAGSHTCRPVFP